MDEIIYKKISGQRLSDSEDQTLRNWLSADRKNRKIFLQLKMSFLSEDQDKLHDLRNELWNQLDQSFRATSKPRNHTHAY